MVALLGTLLYFQTVGFDYTQDDAIVISENIFTKEGIKGIGGLLGHDTFFGYFKDENKTRLVSGGRYRPLTPIMFAIENEIAGPKPWFSHFISAVCYGLLCWVIFGFTRMLLGVRMNGEIAVYIAAATALLFAFHPIHTEVVANIKGRDEIMAAMGAIGGLWLMLHSMEASNPWKFRLLALGAFFLGFLSKENVITMLGVVPLTLWWYGKNKPVQWVQNMLPIVIASILFIVIRGSVTGFEMGDPPKELMNNPFLKIENGNYVPFTFGEKSATILYTMGKYVQLLIFPYPLTHDYYPRQIDIQTWSQPMVLIYALMWLALLYVAFRGIKNRSWWAYGIWFYVMTMAITSNIVFPIGTNMSERFAFLPSYGFALICALVIGKLVQGGKKTIALSLLVVVLAGYGGWTLMRSRVWKDNHTLFSSDINNSPRSAKLLNAMGGDLVTLAEKETDPGIREKNLRKAQEYLKKALEIHPNYKLSYLLLGNSHFHLGEHDQAIAYFRHVLQLDPGYAEGQRNLGVALRESGRIKGEKEHNLTGAISLLEEAATLIPDDFTTYHLLGVAYGQKGDTGKAIAFFKKELELAPNNATAYFNLGIAYKQIGDEANANASFQKAKELDPNLPQFQNQ